MAEQYQRHEQFTLYDWLGALSDERLDQLLMEGGIVSVEDIASLSPEQHARFFGNVSTLIERFRTAPKTLNEMLPQPPEKLQAVSQEGNSAIYAVRYGGELLPIAHSAMWSLVDIPAGEGHPQLRLYEFGSWIVEAHFRGKGLETEGLTLGEAVALQNIDGVYSRDRALGIEPAAIATVKRMNSMHGLARIGFNAESFHQHPFAAALTCTCGNSSEIHIDHIACPYRRTVGAGEEHIVEVNEIGYRVDHQFVLPNGNGGPRKIPCTFMVHNPHGLNDLEETLGMLYERQQGPYNYTGTVNRNTMLPLVNFYQRYGVIY